jgi:hypothetical protein
VRFDRVTAWGDRFVTLLLCPYFAATGTSPAITAVAMLPAAVATNVTAF